MRSTRSARGPRWPNPERIYLRPAGFYRLSTQFQFPANGTGFRQVIVKKICTGES